MTPFKIIHLDCCMESSHSYHGDPWKTGEAAELGPVVESSIAEFKSSIASLGLIDVCQGYSSVIVNCRGVRRKTNCSVVIRHRILKPPGNR